MRSAATLICIVMMCSMAMAASTADIIVVMDESGSMSGEQAWIGGSNGMLAMLDDALIAEGVTNNRYALVGYGRWNIAGQEPFKHLLDGSDWGVPSDIPTLLTPPMQAFGAKEDGYWALGFALDNYQFRADAALNIILITDEDRDNWSSDTYASILEDLGDHNATLNVIVNNPFGSALGTDGVSSYLADGYGGYTTSLGFTVGNGYGNTECDYVPLAFETGGAAWNLNKLRAGGLTAESFTNSFVDIKVREINSQVPEPATISLMCLGLIGIGLVVCRKR